MAGEELAGEVVDQLLKVFGAGSLFVLGGWLVLALLIPGLLDHRRAMATMESFLRCRPASICIVPAVLCSAFHINLVRVRFNVHCIHEPQLLTTSQTPCNARPDLTADSWCWTVLFSSEFCLSL